MSKQEREVTERLVYALNSALANREYKNAKVLAATLAEQLNLAVPRG